jgi:hypothetical protein
MIEVKWESYCIDGGLDAQTAVEKVVRRLQRGVGSVVCPTHGRPPVLKVRGQGAAGLNIEFETCCQALRERTASRMHALRSARRTNVASTSTTGSNWLERRAHP